MNRTELQGQPRLDASTGTPGRGAPYSGTAAGAKAASFQRFCAVMLAGLTILVSLSDTSNAQSSKARRPSNRGDASTVAPGIRDPMNPDAYMRSPGDQNLLLGAASASRAGPASAGPIVREAPGAAPRVSPSQPTVRTAGRPASGAPAPTTEPRVPATGIWGAPPAPAPATPATPRQPDRVVPNTFATGPAPGAPATATAPEPSPEAVPTAAAGVPVPGSQTPTAAPSPSGRAVPNTFATTPAPAAPATPETANEVVPAESIVVPPLGGRTPGTGRGQLIQLGPDTSASVFAPSSQTPTAAPGQLVQAEPIVVGGARAPAPQTTLIMPGQPVSLAPVISSTFLGSQTAPVYPTLNSTENLFTQGPGAVERQLIAGRPGLTLWREPGAATGLGEDGAAAPVLEPEGPWTLGGDLEKYRAHAVKEGSRDSGESLKKALERTGMTLGDGVNIFVLGYASDRAKPFRKNDGKGLLQEPGKVPEAAGAAVGSLGVGLYSLADLLTLNALPDPDAAVYKDNNPLVRPVIFAGRTVHGVWKTTEEVGNAVTWGLFDNVTGCIGLVIEDIVEVVKHAGQAVTNIARVPFHLAAGKKNIEGTDRALDWVLLVPLELVSNAVEMKGFANMQDYKMAFREKGVIGSVLEFGGSTYIVYRTVDELIERNKDKSNNGQGQNSGGGQGSGGQTPPDTEAPPTDGDFWFFWDSDGIPLDI